MARMLDKFGRSKEYWESRSDEEKERYRVIRPMPSSVSNLDVSLADLEGFLLSQETVMKSHGGVFELIPDFQRGHKWSREQQIAYIESLMRDMAPNTLMFNCPGWAGDDSSGDIPNLTFQCIDGLQRLTAVRAFVAGELCVFDRWFYKDISKGALRASKLQLKFKVYELQNRQDLLSLYLDINSGGTPHDLEELIRVRAMLDAETEAK